MVQQATLSRKTIVTKLFKEKGSLNRHMESIHEGKKHLNVDFAPQILHSILA